MVYTLVLGTSTSDGVEVQVLSRALMDVLNRIDREYKKVDYLRAIYSRYIDEYEVILSLIKDRNNTQEIAIGYWSLVRLIFPAIEAMSAICGISSRRFLQDVLKVPHGYLVWELYRNSLLHSEELRFGVYKNKSIAWSISINGAGHRVDLDQTKSYRIVTIDITRLFKDIRIYLENEIKKNDESLIKVQVGTHFGKTRGPLKVSLELLTSV